MLNSIVSHSYNDHLLIKPLILNATLLKKSFIEKLSDSSPILDVVKRILIVVLSIITLPLFGLLSIPGLLVHALEKKSIEKAKPSVGLNGIHTLIDIKEKEFQNALLDASMNEFSTSQSIKSYHIESEEKRFEIAKIAAAHDGWGTSEYIKNYGIESEEKRL